MSSQYRVHFMPGDGQGWALDEDRRQMRQALKGIVKETLLTQAEIIHTPFWQGLSGVAPTLLKQAFVIAHADNPPFFYSKQPEFLLGQQQVDLWVARSQEALKQFQALQLPVEYIPYSIDPELFFPIQDKQYLRAKFAIPQDAYIIANFHRDSEGADLNTPKLQKAPELMLAIFKKLQERGVLFHVLLAGPRRHWIRAALLKENIPFTFIGKNDVEEDDFGINILDRPTLNELTNAADLMLIPSRWEGGPQSVMEAAACQCKILSTPLGVASDILEPISLYRSISEAANRIEDDVKNNTLQKTIQPQWARWKESHTMISMDKGLKKLYQSLPTKESFQKKILKKKPSIFTSQVHQWTYIIQKRLFKKKLPLEIGWHHQVGRNSDLDEIFLILAKIIKFLGITLRPATGEGIEVIGWPTEDLPAAKEKASRLQWIVPKMPLEKILRDVFFIAPAVQDILNLRKAGFSNPAVVCPLPLPSKKKKEEFLIIEETNQSASLEVWRAMTIGTCIIYPEGSAYYEQLFHGGLPYSKKEDLLKAIKEAQQNRSELQKLLRVPTLEKSSILVRQLLMIVSSQKL